MAIKRLVLVLLALALGAGAAQAATVDVLLRGLQAKANAPDDQGLVLDRIVATAKDARTGEMRVGVILRLDGTLPDLSGIRGLVLGSVHGTIATARLPLSELDALAAVPGIVSISAARMLQASLDMAVPATNVDDVWNGAPAYTGTGVLIGIIDSGIDFTHDDFRHTDGTTRIVSMWDVYGTDGTPPSGFNDGAEYTATRINTALGGGAGVAEADIVGHGTHVSGIAAGNGRASSGQYRGVAYDSDILFVKPYNNGFPEDKTIDAMNYLVQKAHALGQPIAINMSLGGHVGAHDGTSAQEQLIDDLSGTGVVFCVAAGNEGEDDIAEAGPAANHDFVLRIVDYSPQGGTGNDACLATIWYAGSSSPSVSLTFQGETTSPVASGTQTPLDTSAGYIVIDNASQGVDPGSGDKVCYIQWDDRTGTPPSAGDWTITISGGSGDAVAWVAYATMTAGFPNSDQSYSLGMPACAEAAVSVAAFKTRNSWPVVGGSAGYGSGNPWGDTPLGARAPFSSLGPTRDGREKPDLAAPGMAIVSCYSHLQNPPADNLTLLPGGKYYATQGTSMATPFTCGVVGLMLDKNPSLTASDVRTILRDTAIQDGYTGSGWNNGYGAGKIDAAAAVAAVSAPVVATGDIDGDGGPTVLDVVLLVNNIVDPTGHPLDGDQRAMADVFPAGGGDGNLDVSDVARIVAFILETATPGAPLPAPAPARFAVGEPTQDGATWWVPVTLAGDAVAGFQFALTLDGAQWQPGDVRVTGDPDCRAVASRVGDQVLVLLYAPDNAIAPGGVTVEVPFAAAMQPAGAPRLNGLLVADPQGYARAVTVGTGVGLLPGLRAVQVAPNPAPSATTVQFQLGRGDAVQVAVYDLKGRRVRTLDLGNLGEGVHATTWDGRDGAGHDVSAGVYLVRVSTTQQTVTRKVVLTR